MSLTQSLPLVVEIEIAGQGDGVQGRGSGFVGVKAQDWTTICFRESYII